MIKIKTIMSVKDYSTNSKNRYKYWCFTVNNYDETDEMKLKLYAHEKCKYFVMGKECGKKKETPHLQGYMQLKKVTAGTTIKNQSKCLKIWLHPTNGSGTSARDYCLKEDKEAYQFGDFIDHPAREGNQIVNTKNATKQAAQQWHNVKDDIMKGRSELEMMQRYPHLYYKHHSGISKGIALANKIPRRDTKTCLHVYIGPPGVGKTTKANELVGDEAYWYDSPNKIWWTGYNGQKSVVFDDFHGNYPFDAWKKLVDKYPLQVPVHNGMTHFNSNLLVITSNLLPSQWWRQEVLGTHGMAALYRRINVLQTWDENSKEFVDLPSAHPLWESGCICSQVPDAEVEVLTPELDLSDSELVPLNVPQEIDNFLELPNPKRRKLNSHDTLDDSSSDVYDVDTLDDMSDDISEDFA